MSAEAWGRSCTKRVATRDIPRAVLSLIVERDGTGCVWCRRQGLVTPTSEPIEVDHLVPLAKGGTNHWSNLALACRAHNRSKRDRAAPAHPPTWARGPRGLA